MLDNNQRGSRPLVYQEVIDYHTEPIKMDEYFGSGKVTEFNYGTYISNCIWNGRDYNCLGGLSSSVSSFSKKTVSHAIFNWKFKLFRGSSTASTPSPSSTTTTTR